MCNKDVRGDLNDGICVMCGEFKKIKYLLKQYSPDYLEKFSVVGIACAGCTEIRIRSLRVLVNGCNISCSDSDDKALSRYWLVLKQAERVLA